jgi:very-short-patch-repair endonuclease
MVAVLSCGNDAVLSHGSAAALWGIGHEQGHIDVTIRRRSQPRSAGVIVRSRPALPAADVSVHRWIPATSPARTLLDQATQVEVDELERQVNEADARDLIDPEALRRYLDLRPGQPGVVPLRALLDHATFRLSDSRLEQMLRPLIAAAGLPPPQTRQRVNEFRVDFYWSDIGFVLEADSFRHHRTALKQRRDLVRDQTHVARGLVPLRVSHWQVAHERPYVVDLLRQVTARLAPAATAPTRRTAPTPLPPRAL